MQTHHLLPTDFDPFYESFTAVMGGPTSEKKRPFRKDMTCFRDFLLVFLSFYAQENWSKFEFLPICCLLQSSLSGFG
uniref:DDE_Tnp_1_7 domain-containing protein n=1 Tax=Caenorhabditis tropicalis TaxID=1561998 RepID=A0A1I7TX64_9PELO